MNKIFFFTVLILLLNSSCTNYHNEAIDWIDGIKTGTSIGSIKKVQPDFLTIDWENPKISDKGKSYEVIEIKGNNDLLNMSYYLDFENDKFIGRASFK